MQAINPPHQKHISHTDIYITQSTEDRRALAEIEFNLIKLNFQEWKRAEHNVLIPYN